MMTTKTMDLGRRSARHAMCTRTGHGPKHLWALTATIVVGVLSGAGFGEPAVAAGADSPVRVPAQIAATRGHDPYPLVMADSAGNVRLALREFADGLAHFYTFMAGELPVEFFIIWTPDNILRVAYNACDVCYRAGLGYRQEVASMICNNCGNLFPVEKIGAVSGGCNPAPLAARIEQEELVMASSVLVSGLSYFP